MEQLSLRKATMEDAKMLFDWKNESLTRQNSFSSEPVPWETHVAWLERKLADENCQFFIMCEEGNDVGTFRVDVEPETGTGVMSCTLDKGSRGNHILERILVLIEEEGVRLGLDYLVGEVKPHNIPVRKALDKNNYDVVQQTDKEIIYKKQIR